SVPTQSPPIHSPRSRRSRVGGGLTGFSGFSAAAIPMAPTSDASRKSCVRMELFHPVSQMKSAFPSGETLGFEARFPQIGEGDGSGAPVATAVNRLVILAPRDG